MLNPLGSNQFVHMETQFELLLQELQKIWDEVGVSDAERDTVFLSIEEESMKVFRTKVDDAKKCKVELQQQIVNHEAELAHICSAMGEQPPHFDRNGSGSLKKELETIIPELEHMKKRKTERKDQFFIVFDQLQKISNELSRPTEDSLYKMVVEETDLSLKKLDQLHKKLLEYHDEKLQNHATALLEMWNLMDTPTEEQDKFQNVTSHIAASESEITEPNMLSMDFLNHVEAEMSRLEQLKSSKLKELLQKKRSELVEICKQSHMVSDTLNAVEYSIEAVESGAVGPTRLLEQIELQITRSKEEALSRKEILERVEKWLAACQEECWLEEYNRDDNRYNAGRGAHLILKRAEKARALVTKIPGMVETLTSKTTDWEKERGTEFLYDGGRLLSMLRDYSTLRWEKEQEKQRQRDMKRFQGQVLAEQEALYGAKRSPSKSGSKTSNRKMSLGGVLLRNQKLEKSTPRVRPTKDILNQNSSHQKYRGIEALSSGRRNSELPGVKRHQSSAVKALEMESPLIRKPLSPVFSEVSSKANIANVLEGQKMQQIKTPPKQIIAGDEENGTPMTMAIPVPPTPSTMSVHMLTAMTPVTPFTSGARRIDKPNQPVEYSFEEVRAGFV